ncbi:hypothetical protein A3B49_00635 [Candidatus Daviesbacteria bacterium RIFCSPLOWO2_01_FULL_40_24]|uniref:tetrahydrofolate synthase n=1 Tax=Candidatus Daviesbacteria bacterium RIFCSPLOWO2_01_FULL_40_24 TaxID=1797787 RepID=A0A1F5MJB1_9BACT|nr:MAG: hypothetical protein A3B49_00635 [Candidatus Daviesbacteria bacterium RIFCSPLOWO2_01_FULL_40_24]
MIKIKSLKQAEEFLYKQIPKESTQIYSGAFGLKRTKYLLKLLGDPQEKIRVIHTAGTSGKGSTSYLISHLLRNLGFKVGLHLSPHLVDIRERALINNKIIKEQQYIKYLNELIPYLSIMGKTEWGKATYFETLTVLAFYIFYQERVDYAVVETGLGGLLDATNAIENPNKLAVITRIGLDHTKILGKTIKEIAFQKAGIIHTGNQVIALHQHWFGEKVLVDTAKTTGAEMTLVSKGRNYLHIKSFIDKTEFDFQIGNLSINNIKLTMIGEHQAENCGLALAVLYKLSQKYNFKLDLSKVRKSLSTAHFPGRFDVKVISGRTVILDGAHNAQKMGSLVSTIQHLLPGEKLSFLVAFKKGKDYYSCLKLITKIADSIIITRFFVGDEPALAEDPEKIKRVLNRLGYKNYQVVTDPKQALKMSLGSGGFPLVITGSLYFLSDIYGFMAGD